MDLQLDHADKLGDAITNHRMDDVIAFLDTIDDQDRANYAQHALRVALNAGDLPALSILEVWIDNNQIDIDYVALFEDLLSLDEQSEHVTEDVLGGERDEVAEALIRERGGIPENDIRERGEFLIALFPIPENQLIDIFHIAVYRGWLLGAELVMNYILDPEIMDAAIESIAINPLEMIQLLYPRISSQRTLDYIFPIAVMLANSEEDGELIRALLQMGPTRTVIREAYDKKIRYRNHQIADIMQPYL